MKSFSVSGKVKRYPGPGGWYYVAVPKQHTVALSDLADRGLIPISVTLGTSQWQTSLLPKGDGTHFIALRAAVRQKEKLDEGDSVKLSYKPRL